MSLLPERCYDRGVSADADIELTRPAEHGARWRRFLVFFAIAALVIVLDQTTKFVIDATLAVGESWPPDWPVQATYTTNTGAAFGILQGQGGFLTVIGVIALVVLLVFFLRPQGHAIPVTVPLALIMGGAIGNIIDRVRLGYVIDFIDFPYWPSFNVADSCISIGIASLLIMTALSSFGSERSGS